MVSLQDFDLMMRAAAMAVVLLFALVLARDHGHTLPARLALCMFAGIVCHLFSEMPGYEQRPAWFNAFSVIAETSMFPFFWLFTRAWFDDENRIGWRSWLVVGLVAMLTILNIMSHRDALTDLWFVDLAARTSWVTLLVAGLWVAWRGRNDDLVEARRRLRTGFIWTVGTTAIIITSIYLVYNQMLGIRAPESIAIGVSTAILLIGGALAYALLGVRQANLFEARERSPMTEDPTLAPLAERLKRHMTDTLAWRDETLTIASLATQLGEQEYRLRRTINRHLGYRNFASFLNGYRLDEVRAALADKSQSEVPILTIALDAGFGSLGTFNRAFRDAEGMTPSAFRQVAGKALVDSEMSARSGQFRN
jgi:AraC-like DNA-binding protein